MLELRPVCENCGKKLPADSNDAMICTYECTFCNDCVHDVLHNICPNCGGGFERRPIRPKERLVRDPQQTTEHFKPVDLEKFEGLLKKYKAVEPDKR